MRRFFFFCFAAALMPKLSITLRYCVRAHYWHVRNVRLIGNVHGKLMKLRCLPIRVARLSRRLLVGLLSVPRGGDFSLGLFSYLGIISV